jgi:hypothetical protein
MIKEELIEVLGFLFNPANEIGLTMYFIVGPENAVTIKQADISEEVMFDLRDQFLGYIRTKLIANDELFFADLRDADTRQDSAYYFDLDVLPEGLRVMETLLANERAEDFNFRDDNYDDVIGFVFLIGNEMEKIAVYKKHYPINLLRQDSILRLYKSGTRLVEVEDDIINLNEKFDFMQIDDDVIVLNVTTLEKFFGFEDIIRTEATKCLATIEAANLLANMESLREMLVDVKFARKLMRIRADSPVLGLPFAKIRGFIRQHPKLRRRIRFNAAGTRISLDTRTSKELFLKLLDDDFLKSDLTDFLYETEKKYLLSNEEAVD